jgi:hypothetical protein
MSFTVIYYTDSNLHPPLWRKCIGQLDAAIIDAAESEPCPPEVIALGNRHMPELPGWWQQHEVHGVHGLHDCYTKIVRGLMLAQHNTIFLAEHDVLYPVGYFDHSPRAGAFDYCRSVFRQNVHGFFPWWCNRHRPTLTSCVSASRALLCEEFAARLAWVSASDKYPAGRRIVVDEPGVYWQEWLTDGQPIVARPEFYDLDEGSSIIDIRHGHNLTGMRESETYLDHLPYWGSHADLWRSYELPA